MKRSVLESQSQRGWAHLEERAKVVRRLARSSAPRAELNVAAQALLGSDITEMELEIFMQDHLQLIPPYELSQSIHLATRTLVSSSSTVLGSCQVAFLRRLGLAIGAPALIQRNVEFRNPNQIRLGRNVTIKRGSVLSGRSSAVFGISLDEGSYLKEGAYLDAYGGTITAGRHLALGQGVVIHGHGSVVIGNYVMIGSGAAIIASNHNYGDQRLPYMLQGTRGRGIDIGDNVWLGANAIVLDGARIGSNVIVGAGTVISGEIPSNTRVTASRHVDISPLGFRDRSRR